VKKYNIAVVGASGAVGEELFRVLEEVEFPIETVLPLASANSAGQEVECQGKAYKIQELTEDVFRDKHIDIAFFLQVEVSQKSMQSML
jgi:aspartate-semialdehyde dehydrogenase